jgi:hypothetical protein
MNERGVGFYALRYMCREVKCLRWSLCPGTICIQYFLASSQRRIVVDMLAKTVDWKPQVGEVILFRHHVKRTRQQAIFQDSQTLFCIPTALVQLGCLAAQVTLASKY